MKKIIVSGTLGFIFSNFIKYVVDEYPEFQFVGVDKAVYEYNLDNQFEHPNYKFYLADIADKDLMDRIFKIEKPDIFLNSCAESFVDKSIANFSPFLHSNVIGVQNVIDMCLKYNTRLLHTSTDECMGQILDINDPAWTEESVLAPRNPYAASKACSEFIINSAHHTHGLQYQITRCCNVFGPSQKKENLVPHIIHSLIYDQSINIFGSGLQFRQYIYVQNKINAIMAILKYGKLNEIYNIGDNNFFTNLEMVNYIGNILNKTPNINFTTDRKAHDFGYKVNYDKLLKLGWKPTSTFNKNMEKTVEWYLQKLK